MRLGLYLNLARGEGSGFLGPSKKEKAESEAPWEESERKTHRLKWPKSPSDTSSQPFGTLSASHALEANAAFLCETINGPFIKKKQKFCSKLSLWTLILTFQ